MKANTFIEKDDLWKNKETYLNRKRYSKILNFIDEIKEPVLDIGERNPLIEFIENELNINTTSSDKTDMDYQSIRGQYGTIFFFAVIEHLFNPLFALENIKKALKNDGIIYLSTPHRPHFLWTEHHFHEMDTMRIQWLFERANLKIMKHEKHYLHDKWFRNLRGLRPFCRIFYKSMGLYQLKKL